MVAHWAWLVVPAVAVTALLWVVAGRAFYVSPDSVSYVGTARNLLDGQGFTPPPGAAPVGHFPPLFTLVLAGLGGLGPDPLTVARWLNPALLGASLILLAVLVRAITGSPVAGGVAAVALAAGYDVLAYHSSALSEPLFLVLVLASIAALAAHLRRPRQWLPAVAGGLAGGAVLTRYAGAALVLTGVVALAWWGRRRPRRALVDSALFAVVAVAPALVWLAWARHAAGYSTGRKVMYHPFDRQYFERGARVASEWFLPRSVSPGVRMGAAALLATGLIAVALLVRRRAPRPVGSSEASVVSLQEDHSPLTWLLGAFALAYLGLLLVDRMLLDVTGQLEPRLVMPLHVVAVALAAATVHRVVTTDHRRVVGGVVLAVAVVLLGGQLRQAGSWSADIIDNGPAARGGFAAPAWRESVAIAEVGRLAPGTPVYSNAADGVYWITGRTARPVPAQRIYLTGELRPAFDREIELVRDDFENRGAVLVWFDAFTARTGFLPSRTELVTTLGLTPGRSDGFSSTYVRVSGT